MEIVPLNESRSFCTRLFLFRFINRNRNTAQKEYALRLNQGTPWLEFLVHFYFFGLWYRKKGEVCSVKLDKNTKGTLVNCGAEFAHWCRFSVQICLSRTWLQNFVSIILISPGSFVLEFEIWKAGQNTHWCLKVYNVQDWVAPLGNTSHLHALPYHGQWPEGMRCCLI